jgi:hypothetical protein
MEKHAYGFEVTMYYPAPMQIFKATNDIKNLWSYVSESG